MSVETKPPPLVAASRIKMLATAFGSMDGTVAGVADKFDRARLEARIRFEKREAEDRRRELYFDAESPDGSFERLPASKRGAAIVEARRAHADIVAASRDAMRHPAILRATMAKLLNPFDKD